MGLWQYIQGRSGRLQSQRLIPFVDPIVVKPGTSYTTGKREYFVLQGDNRGTLWAIRVPVSTR